MQKKVNIKYIKSALLSLLLSISFNYFGQANGSNEVEKIVAWVDNEIILQSEFDATLIQFTNQYNVNNAKNIECKVLETMIVNKVMVAKSKIDSVFVEEEMVDQELERRLQQMFAQYGGDQETILKEYGKTLYQLKLEIRPNLKDQLIIQTMQSKITGDVSITPKEVKQFYKKIPTDSLPKFSTEVEVGHIVRYPKPSQEEYERTKNELEKIKARIEAGESFADLAKIYSMDPGSGARGGELGFFKRGQLVPEYEAAALSMRPGELSKIVKSQFGYHLIQLIERRGNEFNSKHILLKPKTDFKDIERERVFLDSIKLLIESDSLDFTIAAFKHNEEVVTKATNGFLTDYEGNLKIPVEKLGSIYFTIEDMNPGDISKPLNYTDQETKTAVRIIYLKSKTPPHVANLSDDYQKLKEAALAEKKNIAVENWFKETKKQIYIRVDDNFNTCEILE